MIIKWAKSMRNSKWPVQISTIREKPLEESIKYWNVIRSFNKIQTWIMMKRNVVSLIKFVFLAAFTVIVTVIVFRYLRSGKVASGRWPHSLQLQNDVDDQKIEVKKTLKNEVNVKIKMLIFFLFYCRDQNLLRKLRESTGTI